MKRVFSIRAQCNTEEIPVGRLTFNSTAAAASSRNSDLFDVSLSVYTTAALGKSTYPLTRQKELSQKERKRTWLRMAARRSPFQSVIIMVGKRRRRVSFGQPGHALSLLLFIAR